MPKIQMEYLPPPPQQYDPRQQADLVRILQLTLQRVNYARETDLIRNMAKDWIGF